MLIKDVVIAGYMPNSTVDAAESTDKSETALASLQRRLEWDCNETNNNHCKIETELSEDSHSPYLRVWPRTNNRGEYVKTSGWDNVLRSVFSFEREHEGVYVGGVDPDSGCLLVRERE